MTIYRLSVIILNCWLILILKYILRSLMTMIICTACSTSIPHKHGEKCGLHPFWYLILYALTDKKSFSCHTDVSCCLRRASKHRQCSSHAFPYLPSKPLPLTAVFTTAVCLFQKHNIAIICQLIPAWTLCIVNLLQHTLTWEVIVSL